MNTRRRLALLPVVLALTGACADTDRDLRDYLSEPTEFRLMPYVSMAELGLRVDGQPSPRALSLTSSDVIVRADDTGDVSLDRLDLAFASVVIDADRRLDTVRARVAPGMSCLATEWSASGDACFAHARAWLDIDGAAVELDLMVSTSLHEGVPVIDLMVGEAPQHPLGSGVSLASVTLVLHGVAAD